MNVCKCIPWDMIRHDDVENIHMCDRFSNNCFQTKMKNTTHAKKSCFCLPKCNAIHFTQSEEKILLDINNIHLKHSEEKLMVAIDRICQEFDPRKPYKQLLSNDLNDFLQMSKHLLSRILFFFKSQNFEENFFFFSFFQSITKLH